MTKQVQTKVAFDDKVIHLFEGNLRRIFAMKVSATTLREIQDMILHCANQDREVASFLLETLLTGEMKYPVANEKQSETLERVIEQFTIPTRFAKEVFERGEFINMITSDLLTKQNPDQCAFLNRIKRIDGEEFVFMSDPLNIVQLACHFGERLQDLAKHPSGKGEIANYKKELRKLADMLSTIA